LIFFPGLFLLVGFDNARAYLIRRDKLHATLCFFGGIALVLAGWALFGFLLEFVGFVNLFGIYFNPLSLALWALLSGLNPFSSSQSRT
jgi:hypothetical protein